MLRRSLKLLAAPFLVTLALAALAQVTLPVAAQPGPLQCPALQLDNPNPGDGLMPGAFVVSGIAFDPSSSIGSGVSRIDFFLGSRDAGGMLLGSVQPLGTPGIDGPPRFQIVLTIPKMISPATELVAYAFDAMTSGETTVSVPVRVGDIPPPRLSAGVPTPVARVSSNCDAVPTAVNLAPPLPAEIAFTPTPPAQLSGPLEPASGGLLANAPGAIFELANPSPGDVVPLGGYVVTGTAYDPASAAGPGVDRVQFFLDPRDQGGRLLGSAVPGAAVPGQAPTFTVTIQIPNSVPKGTHLFSAYAHSSVIGAETVIQVQVFIGEKPTPTPLPS